jgi:hypothetical protein
MTLAGERVSVAGMQNSRALLRMIRDTIEELGPVGALPSEEAVLQLYGPEPRHEAAAIVDALRRILAP